MIIVVMIDGGCRMGTNANSARAQYVVVCVYMYFVHSTDFYLSNFEHFHGAVFSNWCSKKETTRCVRMGVDDDLVGYSVTSKVGQKWEGNGKLEGQKGRNRIYCVTVGLNHT